MNVGIHLTLADIAADDKVFSLLACPALGQPTSDLILSLATVKLPDMTPSPSNSDPWLWQSVSSPLTLTSLINVNHVSTKGPQPLLFVFSSGHFNRKQCFDADCYFALVMVHTNFHLTGLNAHFTLMPNGENISRRSPGDLVYAKALKCARSTLQNPPKLAYLTAVTDRPQSLEVYDSWPRRMVLSSIDSVREIGHTQPDVCRVW